MRSLVSALLASVTTAAITYHPAPQLIRADVLEFLSHIEMVDTPTDDYGGIARTVRISGINVQVVNGLGSTDTINGTGNLIVGYDEMEPDANHREGSHNIVGGGSSHYQSYGGLVVGVSNGVMGPCSSVTGGINSRAWGNANSISGGFQNATYGVAATVSGGSENVANEWAATVSGGGLNHASGRESWVGGGYHNESSGPNASASGGYNNEATGDRSSVCSGMENTASAFVSCVAGGAYRSATGVSDWVAGTLFEDN